MPLEVVISILGARSETHDKITQKKGSYQKAMEAIRLLRERGVYTRIATVIMRQNAEELINMDKLAKNLGASSWYGKIRILPMTDGSQKPLLSRALDHQIEQALRCYPQEEIRINSSRRDILNEPICRIARNATTISAYGNLNPCMWVTDQRHNLKEKPFSEIWQNSPSFKKMRSLKKKDLPVCRDCDLLFYCDPCLALSLFEKGNLILPSTECCRAAKIRKKVYEKRTKKGRRGK
jgi:radical SAM protein with 4Fe4S-binding SPASM domain